MPTGIQFSFSKANKQSCSGFELGPHNSKGRRGKKKYMQMRKKEIYVEQREDEEKKRNIFSAKEDEEK